MTPEGRGLFLFVRGCHYYVQYVNSVVLFFACGLFLILDSKKERANLFLLFS